MSERRGVLWRFVVLLLCLAAAAVNTGNNLLYLILSLMVSIAAVAYVVAGRSLRRLEPALHLPEEVAAGRPFILGLEVRASPGRLPVGWAEAALEGLPGDAPAFAIPALPPGGRAVVSAAARAERRGVHSGLAIEIASRFPFGLFRRRRRVTTGATLVVTPRRYRIRGMKVEAPSAAGSVRSARPGEGADLYNIRDYTAQDDARRIDWKASARLDRPMFKEFEREQEHALEIVLDERTSKGQRPEAFEHLVETAASILDHCAEKGIQGSLVVPREGAAAEILFGRAAMVYLADARGRAGAPPPDLAGPRQGSAPRIVLSLDPAARTRIHVEWAEPRETPPAPPGRTSAESGP